MSARTKRVMLLAALLLGALALRPQVTAIGPLIPRLQEDLGMSHAVAGLLSAIPLLCLGLFAVPAPLLSRRVGTRLAVVACIALVTAFGVARALSPGTAAVVLLTFPVSIGAGVAGALMPVVVKERFSHRPAFATGIYVTGWNGGAALAAALAVPLATIAGGWRGSLLILAGFSGVLVVGWLLLTLHEPPHRRVPVEVPHLPLRSPIAWALTGIFTLLAVVGFGFVSWVPDAFVEEGWSEASAGALLAVMLGAALPVSIAVPWLADHVGSRRIYLAVGGASMLGGAIGIALAPAGGWIWATMIAVSFGILMPVIMTLPLDITHDPSRVGAITGLMFGAGYTIATASPLALGALRDATGDFGAGLWVMVGCAALLFLSCLAFSHERLEPEGEALPALP